MSVKNFLESLGLTVDMIRWDLTPNIIGETVMITTQEEFDAYVERQKKMRGMFFYINVWDCQAYLCLANNNENSTSVIDCYDDKEDEKMQELLLDAVNRNGAINMSGWYPITKEIKDYILSGE